MHSTVLVVNNIDRLALNTSAIHVLLSSIKKLSLSLVVMFLNEVIIIRSIMILSAFNLKKYIV